MILGMIQQHLGVIILMELEEFAWKIELYSSCPAVFNVRVRYFDV
jgi:hypothetical protein